MSGKCALASACFVVVALIGPIAWAGDVTIEVAPNTINLGSNGSWLTIHADVPYDLVVVDTVAVTVNGQGVTVGWTKADACGDLVVKLDLDAVKEKLVAGESATVVLSGTTKTGDNFSGSDTVRVIKPSKR